MLRGKGMMDEMMKLKGKCEEGEVEKQSNSGRKNRGRKRETKIDYRRKVCNFN